MTTDAIWDGRIVADNWRESAPISDLPCEPMSSARL